MNEIPTTPKLGLKKPRQEDFYNVDDFNYNADILDEEISKKANQEDLDNITPEQIGAETPSGAQEKVDALAGAGNTKTVKQIDDAVTTHLADYATEIANRVKKNGDSMSGVYNIENIFFNLAQKTTTAVSSTTGIKIKTNLIAKTGEIMLTVVVKGYNYGNFSTPRPIQLLISFYITSQAEMVYNPGYSTINSLQPEIKVAHENNKIVIWLDIKQNFNTIIVESANSNNGKSYKSYFQGWSIVEEEILETATNVVIVPLRG